MDPNQALANIRNARDDYGMASSIGQQDDAAERIIEHFEALDSWLSRGGFLPDAWESEADFTGARPHHNPDEEDRRVDERGPNHRFQMYTREGNDAVARMVEKVITYAQANRSTRDEVINHLRAAVAEVARTHPEIRDTEPRGEILDDMDRLMDDLGYTRLEFLP